MDHGAVQRLCPNRWQKLECIPILPFLKKLVYTFDRLSLSVVALSIASCMPSGRVALDVRAASQLF